MNGQETNPANEYAARGLVLQKIEAIARARGYAFWGDYPNQINYIDCSFGELVVVEIMRVDGSPVFDGEKDIVGVLVSAEQPDVTTEKSTHLWLRPKDKADISNLDLPKWLCDYEPYALEEAEIVKSRPYTYWVEKAGSDGLVHWIKKVGNGELSVELTFKTVHTMQGEVKCIDIYVGDVDPPPIDCSRGVVVSLYLP